MGREIEVGAHTVRAEPPDLFVVVFRGDLRPEEVQEIVRHERQVAMEAGYVFILADVTGLGDVPVAARKAISEGKDLPSRGTAICGATFRTRLLATMVMTVQRLLNDKKDNPMVFCKSLDEGREWLAARRAALGLETTEGAKDG
ncbi:hypothetical protein [Chondromyces apiculatus]|uniref:STAS/SEC14 domain-containing protein n=1 Tax=Chondromyces apiculatus DSM 436 TaxID=1192034 RepID=A0A017TB14_9BACT|nr:hypothetical protein [Chondromyces apiculatus]EYF06072.1 Hypothetical protein CAP_2262 [Chondromyces apiculatus DSM 436]